MNIRTLTAVAFGLVVAATGAGKAPARKDAPRPQGILTAVEGYSISEGDEAQLFCVDGRGRLLNVGVADNWGSFSDLQKAIGAADTEGVRKLVKEDRSVKLLASGTRVRVIKLPLFPLRQDPEDRDVEIRILDGPAKGETGYAIYELVRMCRTSHPKAKGKSRR